MNIDIKIMDDPKYVSEVVDIHMKTFSGFFLTFLGRGFLKTLYTGFMDYKQSDVIIALKNESIIGFCAFSSDLSGFYKYLIKKKIGLFALYGIGAFFRKPQILFRLLRAFTYSSASKRDESYVELSSIGVLPSEKNLGVGSLLIEYLIECIKNEKYMYVKLETDNENNEGANKFYKKNGFKLANTYTTPEGRIMNEYRYYLGE